MTPPSLRSSIAVLLKSYCYQKCIVEVRMVAIAYRDIFYEVDDYRGMITLNRPRSLNAFTDTLLTGWVDAIESAKRDPRVRVLVVTGAGRGFCSGMDVAS